MTEGLPQLNEHEARVFGVLVEKSMTTPDHYPLTLNAATAGANQKSNRSPQVDWLEAEVDVALQGLVMKGLVGVVSPAGARVEKFRHNGQPMLGIGDAPLAILAELLMRGPQTPGELRGRASRMSPIPTLEDLNAHLEELMARGLARRVAPAPGSRAGRIAQSLVPDLHPVEEGAPSVPAAAHPGPAHASPGAARAPGLVDRVETLERQVAELRGQLEGLMAELGGPGGRADS